MVQVARAALPGRPRYIADFAAGGGQLLQMARHLWPNANFVATDIDRRAVCSLRRTEPEWEISRCDFLSSRSRRRCSALRKAKGKISLLLLNPPFSCRGGSRVSATLGGRDVRCSVALAFLVSSIEFLAPDGQIVAVLPAGSLESEKDESVWAELCSVGSFEVVATNGHRAFPDSTPRTLIVRFALGGSTARRPLRQELGVRDMGSVGTETATVSIVRGTLQLHRVGVADGQDEIPLVHSTELRVNRLDLTKRQAGGRTRLVCGPAVLLPRVGQPTSSKLVYHPGGAPFAISDCVIALVCETEKEARRLHAALLEAWALIERNYVGSCARYITVRRIASVLESLGFDARSGGASCQRNGHRRDTGDRAREGWQTTL